MAPKGPLGVHFSARNFLTKILDTTLVPGGLQGLPISATGSGQSGPCGVSLWLIVLLHVAVWPCARRLSTCWAVCSQVVPLLASWAS